MADTSSPQTDQLTPQPEQPTQTPQREVLSISSGGASVSFESTQAAALGRKAAAEAEIMEMRLAALKRGAFITTIDNPGPIQR